MFPPTDWKLIFKATLAGDPAGRKALNALCCTYRPPVVAFLRSKGWDAEDSADLAQELFRKLCASRAWKAADEAKGKFRTFLLTILDRITINQLEYKNAKKRGGGFRIGSLEGMDEENGWEPADEPVASPAFDREWARQALREARARVEARWIKRGKTKELQIYRQFLPGGHKTPDYSEVATQLGITETAVRKTVQRLREELCFALRQEVGATVSHDGDVDEEMRYLGEILANPEVTCPFENELCSSAGL